MEQQKPTTGKFSLQFGVLAGLAGTAFSIMLYTMGMAYEQSPAQSAISIGILFGVIFYFPQTFGIETRDFENEKHRHHYFQNRAIVHEKFKFRKLRLLSSASF